MARAKKKPAQKSVTRTPPKARPGAYHWGRSGYDTFGYDSPAFRRWLAAQLPARKSRILSVGCGSGEVEAYLRRLRHVVVGLDLAPPMLRRAAKQGLDLVVAADARKLPFGAARFDLVLMIETIGYLALDEVFAEARRVLGKSGRLLVTSYGPRIDAERRYRKWRMSEIVEHLEAARFRIAAQRFLEVKKTIVRAAPSEESAGLLYLAARVDEGRGR